MTTLQDIEQSRAEFEKHMLGLNACTRLYRQPEAAGGEYRTVTVERAWKLWQAARSASAAPVELPEPDMYAVNCADDGHQPVWHQVGWEYSHDSDVIGFYKADTVRRLLECKQ